MNYYNPYFFNIPTKTGLFSNLFKNINFSSILNGTNKALNFVNQTIPIVKKIPPMIKNAKTMFSVVNEFKKMDDGNVNKKNTKNDKNIKKEDKTLPSFNKPTFFI